MRAPRDLRKLAVPQAVPSYRKRVIRGREVAYLTLRDRHTKLARDFSLGPYGSEESHELYRRLIAEWAAASGRLPARPGHVEEGITVTQLCFEYWQAVNAHLSTGEVRSIRRLIRLLRSLHGTTPAALLGPNALRSVRDAMVAADWSRRYCNSQTRRIVALYKWGVAHELVPARVYESLRTIEPLIPGRTTARETQQFIVRTRSAAVAHRVSPPGVHYVRSWRQVLRCVCQSGSAATERRSFSWISERPSGIDCRKRSSS